MWYLLIKVWYLLIKMWYLFYSFQFQTSSCKFNKNFNKKISNKWKNYQSDIWNLKLNKLLSLKDIWKNLSSALVNTYFWSWTYALVNIKFWFHFVFRTPICNQVINLTWTFFNNFDLRSQSEIRTLKLITKYLMIW